MLWVRHGGGRVEDCQYKSIKKGKAIADINILNLQPHVQPDKSQTPVVPLSYQ
jgi:hypothetical protein